MATSAQYWRIFVNGATNGSSVVAIAELVFYGAGDFVPISTSGATTSSSTHFNSSFVDTNVIDGNPNTAWASNANPSSGSPQWVQVQFTGAVSVAFVSVAIRNDSGAWTTQSPPNFLIQSSPDGSTWTTRNTVSGFNWTSNGQVTYFDASSTLGHARVTQAPVEVVKAGSQALASQLAVELAFNASPHAKASALPIEAMLNASAHVKGSQVCLEVMFPYVVQPPVPIMNFMLP
jgi:hypothetical protein